MSRLAFKLFPGRADCVSGTHSMVDHPDQTFAVFTPESMASINRAYAQAIDIVGRAAEQDLRAKLAERMMALARSGELDERRLCSLSVSAVLGHVPDHGI
jgi:hypothetical protein